MEEKINQGEDSEKLKEKMERHDARAVQTLFRTVLRNHYHLLRMVDNKARIMLTINSIITSLLLGMLFLLPDGQTAGLESSVRILLICSMISMIFALFSMLPCRYSGTAYKKSGYKGTLYAQNFSKFTLDEFKQEFNRIMEKGRHTYDEMIVDLYFLGKCISRKQKLLYLSAAVFLIGLVATISYTLSQGAISFS